MDQVARSQFSFGQDRNRIDRIHRDAVTSEFQVSWVDFGTVSLMKHYISVILNYSFIFSVCKYRTHILIFCPIIAHSVPSN